MKPEEKVLNGSEREEKIKKALNKIIEAFRLARARGIGRNSVTFSNSDVVKEETMEDALKISKDLDDKMKNMKIAWIASISIYFALKEDKNITNHFTVHSGLATERFVALARKCKQALSSTLPSDQAPPVNQTPIEDTDTVTAVTTACDAGPVRTIPRPRVEYQVRHFDYKF